MHAAWISTCVKNQINSHFSYVTDTYILICLRHNKILLNILNIILGCLAKRRSKKTINKYLNFHRLFYLFAEVNFKIFFFFITKLIYWYLKLIYLCFNGSFCYLCDPLKDFLILLETWSNYRWTRNYVILPRMMSLTFSCLAGGPFVFVKSSWWLIRR